MKTHAACSFVDTVKQSRGKRSASFVFACAMVERDPFRVLAER